MKVNTHNRPTLLLLVHYNDLTSFISKSLETKRFKKQNAKYKSFISTLFRGDGMTFPPLL